MSLDNNKKHIVRHLLPPISHFSAPQGDILLLSVMEECCQCLIPFVSFVLGSHLILAKCVQLRVLFRYESWFLSFQNRKWSWVLNEIMLELRVLNLKRFVVLL